MQEAVSRALRDATTLDAAGNPAEAYARLAAVLADAPDDGAVLDAAGRLALRLGKPADSVAHFRALVAAGPISADARGILVQALLAAGDRAGAADEAGRLVEQAPKSAGAHNLSGIALRRLGRADEAVARFRAAIALDGKHLGALMNLGNTLRGKGDRLAAIEAYRHASRVAPRHAEAAQQLGSVLCEAGQVADGLKALSRAILLDARNPSPLHDRAVACFNAGRLDEAMTDIDKALALAPDDPRLQAIRAAVLRRVGRLDEAKALYEAVLARNPDDVATLQRYASLCANALGDHRTANTAFQHALRLRPTDARLAAAYCRSLMNSRYEPEGGFIDQAHVIAARIADHGPVPIDCATDLEPVFLRTCDFARAERLPNGPALFEHLLRTENIGALHNRLGRVQTMQDRHDLVAQHRAWGDGVVARSNALPARKPAPPAGRKLRIGIMSSDLRDHPVTYFALPIFEFYDREQVEIYCYSFYPSAADRVQQYIAGKVTAFRVMQNADDRAVAQQIAADGVDILFELGGSTRFNRLDVMALRAAPVQVSWLGYPHSAGIETIDRILVDPYIEPEDPRLLIEKPFRMPESWVTLGRLFPETAIEPGTPDSRTGFITFGTANNPYKFTAAQLGLWARVMQAVPDSRFLLVRPEGGSTAFRSNIQAAFAQHGIANDRVVFAPVRGKHLPYYNQIDIALDSAPHTGGTTTCESLWMGCPTITLVGPAFFERLSYSNLSNAGLADLCAHTPDSYVAIATRLAEDKHRRLDLRQGLRDRIRRNPLGQPERWVRHFEAAARIAVEEAA